MHIESVLSWREIKCFCTGGSCNFPVVSRSFSIASNDETPGDNPSVVLCSVIGARDGKIDRDWEGLERRKSEIQRFRDFETPKFRDLEIRRV